LRTAMFRPAGVYPAAVATTLMWLSPPRKTSHRANTPCVTCARLPATTTAALGGLTVPNTFMLLTLTAAPSVGAVRTRCTACGDWAPPHPALARTAITVAASAIAAFWRRRVERWWRPMSRVSGRLGRVLRLHLFIASVVMTVQVSRAPFPWTPARWSSHGALQTLPALTLCIHRGRDPARRGDRTHDG